jgi:hypothetical protein
MATRTITVHDRCTVEGCGRVLHSVREAERGICGRCQYATMPADTKKAMNRLVASAFNGSTEEQKSSAVDDAMAKIKRDEASEEGDKCG